MKLRRLGLPLLLLLPALPAAGDEREEERYAFSDAFWNLTYRAPALRKLLAPSRPDVLFEGRCAGDVSVTLSVHEGDAVEDAARWRARRAAELGLEEPERADDPVCALFYTRPRHGVFLEEHGHAFYARGHHCFEVHAWVPDRAEGSRAAIAAALEGLTLGEDPGCGLRARRLALARGTEPTDPAVLLRAGREYLDGHPALAAGLLARARRTAGPDDLDAEEVETLLLAGGLALLATERPAEAAAWLAEAERRAQDGGGSVAAYHRARAESAAGDLDACFAALDRAFAAGLVVSKARLSKERELENARKDPRWEVFWAARIQGR